MNPVMIRVFDLFRLFNFDIRFTVIDIGIIAKVSTINIDSADSYSLPINESTGPDATSSRTTIGVVKPKLSLKPPEERSFLYTFEEGITIYAILEAKLATTRVIINET